MISWIRYSEKYLDQLCKNESFDLCFAHFVIPGGEVARYLKVKYKIPYVVMSHGHDVPWVRPYSLYFLHALAYSRLKSICSSSSYNLVQTEEMKENMDRFTGTKYHKKNILIPNGCDPVQFRPQDRPRNEVMNIIFSGRLVKQKDPLTLMRALKVFSMATDHFKLHVYGDGPLRGKIEKLVRDYSLSENVVIHGKVASDGIIEAYNHSDLLVSPSLSEGMSITILEAMCTGVYALVTPASGNTGLISHGVNGELFDFKDHIHLAEKISNFYKDKFLTGFKVPAAQLETFRNRYDWKEIVKLYDELIKPLMQP